MVRASHSIFRKNAWEQYAQKQRRTVLPRLVTPPVFMFLWIFFILLFGVVMLAWWEEIPMYVAGSGILVEPSTLSLPASNELIAVIFVPTNHPLTLPKGTPIQLQIGRIGPGRSGQIERVEPGLISPQAARIRYALKGAEAVLITQPSIVVLIKVQASLSAPGYAGSLVSTQLPVGTQRLLTLLLGSGN